MDFGFSMRRFATGGLAVMIGFAAVAGFSGTAEAKKVQDLLITASNANNGVGGGAGGGRYCNRSGFTDDTNPGLAPTGPGQGQGKTASGNLGSNNPNKGGEKVGYGGCAASQ